MKKVISSLFCLLVINTMAFANPVVLEDPINVSHPHPERDIWYNNLVNLAILGLFCILTVLIVIMIVSKMKKK